MSRQEFRSAIQRPYLAVIVAIVVTAVAILSAYPFSEERLDALTKEDGWIEMGTAVLYGVAILALLSACRFERGFFAHSAFAVALLGARELDLHKAFTTDSVLTTRFFFRDHVDLPEKLIAGAVLLVLLVVLIRYLRHWRRLRDGLLQRSPSAMSAALAILLLPATKTLDAFGRIAKSLGFEITFNIDVVGIVEESMEMAIPVVIVLSVVQYTLARRAEDRRTAEA